MPDAIRSKKTIATLKDLAKLLDVDISTVSRALRNDPRVKTATRERVAQAAAAMGYHPHAGARSLAGGKSNVILFICDTISPQLSAAANALSPEIINDNRLLFMAPHRCQLSVYKQLAGWLMRRSADGALIVPTMTSEEQEIAREMLARHVPVVFVNRYYEGLKACAVVTDDTACGAQLVRKCAEMGARFIFILFRMTVDCLADQLRQQGAIDEARRLGLPYALIGPELSYWDPASLPGHIAVVCTADFEARQFLTQTGSKLAGKKMTWGIFDGLNAPPPLPAIVFPSARLAGSNGSPTPPPPKGVPVFICIQDFNRTITLAWEHLRKMIERGEKPDRKIIQVPALRYDCVNNGD